jgi:osmoprotectant transport system ATP-binding protein
MGGGRILADDAPGPLLAGDSAPEVAALMAMPRRQAERISALTAKAAHG